MKFCDVCRGTLFAEEEGAVLADPLFDPHARQEVRVLTLASMLIVKLCRTAPWLYEVLSTMQFVLMY